MELRRKFRVQAFLLVTAALALITTTFGVLAAPPASAAQTIPYKINFQGRLTDNNGNALTDGLYNVKFRLWTAASGGTNQWEADRVFGASDFRVQVTGGLFNIQFGDTTQGDPALSPALFATGASPLYLEVELPTPATATCATNACASFTEGAMTPRQALASAAYAFNSDTLDGLDSTAFAQLSSSNAFTAANIFAPGATAVVGLTAKASTAGGVDSLDVYDSGGAKQAFFNAAGQLNITQTLQPTSNNAVDLGLVTSAFKNLYTANIDTGTTTTALTIGTAQATSIQIGRTSSTLSLESNATLNIGAGGTAHTIQIGNSPSAVQGITIGSIATTSATTIESGPTGTLNIGNGTTSHTIAIGSGNTGTQATTIGSANVAADSLTLEAGNTGKLQIGNGNTAHTIQIGNGGTSTVQGVTIGSSFTGSTTTLQGPGTTEVLAANSTTIQSTTNSTTAFQVENATGIPIFLVDTATSQSGNFLTNGGFEIGAGTPTGWSAIGAPTTFARNTAAPNHYGGQASLQLVTTATAANQGATTSTFTSAPPPANYAVSFYAEVTSGSLTSGQLQAVVNGTATTCTAGVTLSATGFQRVVCPVTAGATITSIGVQVPSTQAAVRTIYIDAVQVVTGASPTPATNGAIQLRGAVDSPVVFQALSNSTTAFQIQNSAGTSNLFVADTLNGRVGIGTATPASMLDVSGNANASTFSVAGTAGLTGVACTGGQVVQNATVTGGILTAGSCATVAGTGATTTLNNLGTTSINASLLPASNNVIDLGSTTAAWKDLYATNIDTAAATPALTIGTTNAASVTLGKANTNVAVNGTFSVGSAGTITGTSAAVINSTATFNSSFTGALYGFDNEINYNPAGGTVGSIYGEVNTATLSGSSLAVNQLFGSLVGVNSTSGYTGTVSNAYGLNISSPGVAGANKFTNYTGLNIGGVTANGNNASGVVTNYDEYINGNTAGAATGGTLLNYGLYLNQPSGTGGTTSNYGLYIQGAGGSTTNYSIFDNSAAPTFFAGSISSVGAVTSTATITAATFSGSGASLTNLPAASLTGTYAALNGSAITNLTAGNLTGTYAGLNGNAITNLNPSNLTTGSGAVTLQPAASTGLNLTTSGTGAITVTPGTGNLAENFAAGISEIQTATAAMTADLFDQTNTSATNAPTADGINLLQQTFYGKPSGTNNESSTRINVTNANTAAGGQVNALRVIAVGAGGAVASDTDGILVDNFTNASSAGTENGVEIGTGWDSGIYVQSGGNTIKATSATGLLVENAANLAALTVDTSGNIVHIGSATTDTSQVLLQLDSFSTLADTATCATATNQGALYYNTASNTIRGCVNGNWEDVVTTSGLGIITYGVVPDSSNAGSIGDLAGITQSNSPCKVYWSGASQVTVAPCYAYSSGRKVTVASTVINLTAGTLPAGDFANICLTGANNQPALLGAATTDAATAEPTWSPNNPVVCLATLQATTAGQITNGKIYDIRTFTNTGKTFATINSTTPLGAVLVQSTATANQAQLPTGAGVAGIRGVVVAFSGAASAATDNVIIATQGPQWVKASGVSTLNQFGEVGTATGYSSTVTPVTTLGFSSLGIATRTIDTTCTSNATCQYSEFYNPMTLR